ncbi:MAG: lipoyl synthase [Candidatus Eisenbacteria bacterium]|nr:lipoyl synthase [Candidatus Latescibacterota bacterium]MBD3301434.1 lipoyl synthase [Candidatus Eisenbacteria bacterium]
MPVSDRQTTRRPDWLKVRLPQHGTFRTTRRIVSGNRLHTVCESARCPNIGECWGAGTATFMILGDVCTRGCGFCAVKTGRPDSLDREEPERVAEAVAEMKVRHAVITSVNRDELPDGGASIFAATTRAIRRRSPGVTVELLIPDFLGDREPLDLVLDARPEILNHNVETVPRLYRRVRPQAKYARSLWVLARSKSRGLITKSSLMVGIGEEEEEVYAVLRDLRSVDCDVATIGQYLQPTKRHLPVDRWVPPEEFERYARAAREMGFRHCESGPLVRSSYRAERALPSGGGNPTHDSTGG